MGAKQSTATAASASSNHSPRVRTFSSGGPSNGGGSAAVATAAAAESLPGLGHHHGHHHHGHHHLRTASNNNNNNSTTSASETATTGTSARQRARSLSSVPNGHSPLSIPAAAVATTSSFTTQGGGGTLPESDSSTPDDGAAPFGRVFVAHSLPAQLWSFNGIKCPVCSKFVLPDDVECHLVMCLTKPRISYNEDVLTEDKGECVICLDDLKQGDTIARLPCLCIYHKSCIDSWFEVNRSCPEHPLD